MRVVFVLILLVIPLKIWGGFIKEKRWPNVVQGNKVQSQESRLFQSIQNEDLTAIALLLKSGVNPNCQDSEGFTPIMKIFSLGYIGDNDKHLQILRLLVSFGANVNAATKTSQQTVLHSACLTNASMMVKELLLQGAIVDKPDIDGQSALFYSVLVGNIELTRLLLAHGANIHLQTKTGRTVLHLAASISSQSMVEFLIKAGANVNAVDRQGITPLMCSARNSYQVFKVLLISGANVQAQDNRGWTPLMFTASCSEPTKLECGLDDYDIRFIHFKEIIRDLIQAGALVNHQNKQGESPLMLAIESGTLEFIQILLEAGANVDHKDKNQHSVFFYAKKLPQPKRKQVIQLLKSRM